MDTTLHRSATPLAKGALLRLADPVGRGIAVFAGFLWLTQHADRRDIFLGPGDSFAFDHNGLAIVQALEASSLIVFDAPPTVQRADESRAAA
jgi:Protein of unknown function (DUF2917)